MPGQWCWLRICYFSGNTVIVDHGLGMFSTFAHLSEIGVRAGDVVTPGASCRQGWRHGTRDRPASALGRAAERRAGGPVVAGLGHREACARGLGSATICRGCRRHGGLGPCQRPRVPVARPLTNNHPVNPAKKVLASLIVVLTVTSSVQVWAQAPQESAAADATVTAPVMVDGQVLFQVRGVSSLPAADRARRIMHRS